MISKKNRLCLKITGANSSRFKECFRGLKDSKSPRVPFFELMRTQCNLSLKMPWFQSVDRHSEGKIQECLD
jgi:hypothetical protein